MAVYECHKDPAAHQPGRITVEFLLSLLFHGVTFSSAANNEVQLSYQCPEDEEPDKPLLRFRNQRGYGLQLENFAFELLVKKIPPQAMLKLVCALLLERKVVLLFQNYQQNAIIMESLLSLLVPLYHALTA